MPRTTFAARSYTDDPLPDDVLFDILDVAERAGRRALVHESHAGGAARQRLEPQRAGASEQVEDARAVQRNARAVLDQVEHRLAHAVPVVVSAVDLGVHALFLRVERLFLHGQELAREIVDLIETITAAQRHLRYAACGCRSGDFVGLAGLGWRAVLGMRHEKRGQAPLARACRAVRCFVRRKLVGQLVDARAHVPDTRSLCIVRAALRLLVAGREPEAPRLPEIDQHDVCATPHHVVVRDEESLGTRGRRQRVALWLEQDESPCGVVRLAEHPHGMAVDESRPEVLISDDHCAGGHLAGQLLSGDLVTGTEAATLGLVGKVVDDDEVVEQAIALAQRISANSPLAVALAKDAALAAQTGSIAAGLEHEKRNFVYSLASDDSHEGQAAFVAKRSPNFTGR